MTAQENRIHILVIEDEAVLAMDLGDTLESEGYRVVGMATNGRRALELFQQHRVDLLLCDISLKGDWDGIETANRLLAIRPVPLIYLTAHADRETIDRAKQTFPSAYLIKPFNPHNLRIAVDLALCNFALRKEPGSPDEPTAEKDAISRETILRIDDHVFIKHNYQFVRLPLEDILLLEADNTYTTLVTHARKYALRMTLTATLNRLGFQSLVRVHRSFAVNIRQIERFGEKEVVIGTHTIPLGRHYKDDFLRHFQFR